MDALGASWSNRARYIFGAGKQGAREAPHRSCIMTSSRKNEDSVKGNSQRGRSAVAGFYTNLTGGPGRRSTGPRVPRHRLSGDHSSRWMEVDTDAAAVRREDQCRTIGYGRAAEKSGRDSISE